MASEHGCDNNYYNQLLINYDINTDTRNFIHTIIGALLIRLKSLHVNRGIFDEIWSNSETVQTNALGWIGDRQGLGDIVLRASRLALGCYFDDDSSSYIVTGAKTDNSVIQAIRDERPCLGCTHFFMFFGSLN